MNSRSLAPDPQDVTILAQTDRQAAMRLVVLRHRARLEGRARSILKDADLACDAVQESFVKAWNEPRFFDDGFRRAAWLYRVTTNLCFNRVRDRRRREDILASRPAREPTRATQADTVQAVDRARIVAHAMANLTDDHREILQERYMNDRSYKEIADHLGLKLGTVMSRLARARSALAHLLPPEILADL